MIRSRKPNFRLCYSLVVTKL